MREKIKLMVLGCAKNRADAESVAGILTRAGYEIVDWESDADAAILLTCSFVREAEEESAESIVLLEQHKREGAIRVLVVAGCMPERHRGEQNIEATLPGVDAWVGASDYHRLPLILDDAFKGRRRFRLPEKRGFLPGRDEPRLRLGAEPFAYLKISEGCRNRCSYCTIPSIRGDFRSRPMRHIIKEAEWLVKNGVREIVLVGQDTALYGADIYSKPRLGELLEKLAVRLPDTWLRAMYCHPAHITNDMLEIIAAHDNICSYLDVPIQHFSDNVLKKMNRHVTEREMDKLLIKIRDFIPCVVLRTTVMVGFPGESERDFEKLVDFLDRTRFERLGAFPFSPEEGTPAFDMKGRVSDRVKHDRLDTIMRLQQSLGWDFHQNLLGTTMEVMVDGPSADRPGWVEARSKIFAPEVDGVVFVKDAGYRPGDRLTVKVVDALPYDLEGETV